MTKIPNIWDKKSIEQCKRHRVKYVKDLQAEYKRLCNCLLYARCVKCNNALSNGIKEFIPTVCKFCYADLESENKRLRDALEEIATHNISCRDCGEPPKATDSCDDMQCMAKKALEGDTDEKT